MIISFDEKVFIEMTAEELGLLCHYLSSAKLYYEDGMFSDRLKQDAFADIDYLQSLLDKGVE